MEKVNIKQLPIIFPKQELKNHSGQGTDLNEVNTLFSFKYFNLE